MVENLNISRPRIEKIGTIDCDIVETTPIVFNNRLLRYEYVRGNYHSNKEGIAYSRLIDVDLGFIYPPFARGYHLGSAYAENDSVFVFATEKWGGTTIEIFFSKDLFNWQSKKVIELPEWGIFNNSVCKCDDRYIMAIEIDRPKEEAGIMFTIRFAESRDLFSWHLTPRECVYSREKYTACPVLRYIDGYFYMIYLEANPGPECINADSFEPWIVRSRDLINWQPSQWNPIMTFSDEDKVIAKTGLSGDLVKRIKNAENINNSDLDICEFNRKTVIYYSWGNQKGNEFLAEAVFKGTLKEFLEGYFST